jgi:hypothetical protein
MSFTRREPWWVWHWDSSTMRDFPLTAKTLKRWRRGLFITVYYFSFHDGGWQLWVYGPFNFAFGIGRG